MLAFVLLAITASAQKLKLSDLSIYAGGSGSSGTTISDNDQRRALSQFNIPSSLTNVTWNGSRKSYNYQSEIGLMATWDIRKKRKRSPWTKQLRLGFSYGDYSTGYISSYNNNETYRVDTLISQQNGSEYYIDSVSGQFAYVENVADMFTIHLNYLMRYNAQRKFSFYTGIGASVGFTLDNALRLSYGSYSYTNTPIVQYNSNFGRNYDNDYNVQTKQLETATAMNIYIPVGINYRISKRSKWLRPLNVFAEWRPGLSVQTSEILGTNASLNNSGILGLRYAFGR